MSACGAIEGFVNDAEAWRQWQTNFPGETYTPPTEFPLYVVSRVVASGPPVTYMHHTITLGIARELLARSITQQTLTTAEQPGCRS